MRYWLTTHYPPLEDGSERFPLRVWLQDGKESVGASMREGDRVLIYEGKTGPSRYVVTPAGRKKKIQSAVGHQGIIKIAEVKERLRQDATFPVFEYGDGKKRWWCWHAHLTLLRNDGYVPLSDVNRVLDYSPNCVLFGFGTKSSGLKEITTSQYAEFERLFSANATNRNR